MCRARRGWTALFAATATTTLLLAPSGAWANPERADCPPAGGRPAPAEGSSIADRLLVDDDVDYTQERGLVVDARVGFLDPDGDARGARTRTALSDVDNGGSDTRFALFDNEDALSGRAAVNVHDLDDIDRDVAIARLDRDCAEARRSGPVLPAPPLGGGGEDEQRVADDGAFVFGR